MAEDNITGDLASVPSGTDYTTLQSLADFGSGVGAQIIGQPYNIFRISQSGDVLQPGNQIFANYPVQRQKLTATDSQGLETSTTQKTFFFSILGDFSNSIVGDCFILNDPVYGVGATIVPFPTLQFIGFFLAIHPVLQKPIGARIDRLVQIYRPAILPDINGYMNTTLQGASPLMLINGLSQLGTPLQSASFIPAGFQPNRRGTGQITEKYTSDIPQHTNWSICLPPLPVASDLGSFFSIREGDIIVSEEGDRYRVIDPYRQDVGSIGYQLIAEREIAPAGGS